MEDSSFIVEAIAGIILFAVGVRLLKLASRTAGKPERLLGLYLTLSGLSYIFYQLPLIRDMGSLELPLTFAGRVTYGVSVYFLLEFTRLVFRRDEAWSSWLVRALVMSLTVGIGASAIQGDWEGYSVSNPWFWCEWLGYTLATTWVSVEALLAYRSARKRTRLGLCDPVIANRYLLWSLFGIFQTCAALVIVPMFMDYEANQKFGSGPDLLLGGFEILGGVAAWFAFCAPGFYRNWIARWAASANSVKGA